MLLQYLGQFVRAFEEIKKKLTTAHIFSLFDILKISDVVCDVSGIRLEEYLAKMDIQLLFLSEKLNEVKDMRIMIQNFISSVEFEILKSLPTTYGIYPLLWSPSFAIHLLVEKCKSWTHEVSRVHSVITFIPKHQAGVDNLSMMHL